MSISSISSFSSSSSSSSFSSSSFSSSFSWNKIKCRIFFFFFFFFFLSIIKSSSSFSSVSHMPSSLDPPFSISSSSSPFSFSSSSSLRKYLLPPLFLSSSFSSSLSSFFPYSRTNRKHQRSQWNTEKEVRSDNFFLSPHPSASSSSSSTFLFYRRLPVSLLSSSSSPPSSVLKATNTEDVEKNTEEEEKKEAFNYSGKHALFFPGQGSQFVGMAVETADKYEEARRLFSRASEILGFNLLQRCKEGPKNVLDRTEICQPAIYVASMAALEKLKAEKGVEIVENITVALGLSLGEYSALCFSGALRFEDGVRITRERGMAMQQAADNVDSGMISVIGVNSNIAEKICRRVEEITGENVAVANYLSSENHVLSGTKKACDMVQKIAKPEFKAKLAIPLAVAGAFHTKFMQPAIERLKQVLDEVEIRKPRIPVLSNVDAQPHFDPLDIKDILTKQVTSPVMWEKSVRNVLSRGFENGYEVGPGTVLAGIFNRLDKTKKIESIQ